MLISSSGNQSVCDIPTRLKALLLVVVTSMSLTGCERHAPLYHEQFLAFGTLIEVKLWGIDPELGRRAVKDIENDFIYLHKAWHPSQGGSLARINQLLPTGQTFTVAPSVLPLVKKAMQLSKDSDGLFNPAIGGLVKLWGFNADTAPGGPPPADTDIEADLAKKPTMADIVLEDIQIRSINDAVRLDFGGFAKGVAVDFAIDSLKQLGITNAVVNAGGDLRAIGRHGDRPWRVGIRNPRGEGVLAAVEVQGDECVFTSGDYERYFEYQGVRYHHILDPRTGYPARGSVSVTVFDNDAGRADAAATALFVAGPDDWFPIAKKMGVKGVLLMDNHGVVHMTPNLKQRVYFQAEPKPRVIYSEPL